MPRKRHKREEIVASFDKSTYWSRRDKRGPKRFARSASRRSLTIGGVRSLAG